jgi:MFS family permease
MSVVPTPAASRTWLPRQVLVLSVVSFLNDVASDIVIPLIPILLASLLASGPAVLGLVEGTADALAALLKLWSGRHSDRLAGRRKPLVVVGYLLSNIARPLMALASGWFAVLVLRSVDRVGKGIRSAPRDAMIADFAPRDRIGLAFGFHRALDNCGAVLGALVAALALSSFTTSLQTVLWVSALPGMACVLLMALAVGEPPKATAPERTRLPPLSWTALSPTMRRYLVVLALFTFARVSETFLVLRGYELGGSVVELLLLWSALNAAKALAAYPGGMLSDRIGRKAVMLASWTAFAASFYFLCRLDTMGALWAVTLLYGAFAGLSEGAERALIEDLGESRERGTAFGWYYLMTGIAAIPAGAAFGLLWQYAGPSMAFSFAAAMACASALLIPLWVGEKRE